jgi:hypothetical protein
MSKVSPGDEVKIRRTTQNSNGNATDADELPVAKLIRNGDDTDEVVTVTWIDTGEYKLTTTVPANWNAGDEVEIFWTATVAGITGKTTTWTVTLAKKNLVSFDCH